MWRWWHDHSLTIVLSTVLAVQTVYSLVAGANLYPYEFPASDPRPPFLLWWSWEYNESILADVFGGLVLVYSTKVFRERGSPESGDDR